MSHSIYTLLKGMMLRTRLGAGEKSFAKQNPTNPSSNEVTNPQKFSQQVVFFSELKCGLVQSRPSKMKDSISIHREIISILHCSMITSMELQ